MNIDINARNFEKANEVLASKSQELTNIYDDLIEYTRECEEEIKNLKEEINRINDEVYDLEQENEELKGRLGL